jgi:hypothetical protein
VHQTLALVTPPATEPVTLEAAKEWLRIDGADDDATITNLIGTARQAAEDYLRRSLVTQSWKLNLDLGASSLSHLGNGVYDQPVSAIYGELPRVLPLPKGPVQSITSVTTYDLNNAASVFASSNYRVDASGDRLILNHGALWPSSIRPLGGCEIVYTAGYGTSSSVPQPIRTGILIHLASLYEQRGMCDDAMVLPPGVEALYNRYRIMDYRG